MNAEDVEFESSTYCDNDNTEIECERCGYYIDRPECECLEGA